MTIDSAELDLAENLPGQAARRQADVVRRAAPVRSAVARMLRVHTDERAWRIGADGEVEVGRVLAKLVREEPGWRVLHSIPIGSRGADIDHLVIGPAGVFTLNTKHHPGAKIWVGEKTFLVNGVRQPYLRNSGHEAERVSRLLTASCGFPVEAIAVIVPVNAGDVVVRTPPLRVHVVTRRRLARWLRARGRHLGQATVDTIYETARRPATWRQS